MLLLTGVFDSMFVLLIDLNKDADIRNEKPTERPKSKNPDEKPARLTTGYLEKPMSEQPDYRPGSVNRTHENPIAR
jgi:hypothetical protein